jgi:glycosyltransferase involved in cell wall biosynthesis
VSAPRLAILSTHPIQYYAPLFRAVAQGDALDVHVFYGWEGAISGAHDPGFDADVTWDIPLLEGYPHTFMRNSSSDPGTHHFRGIVNPNLVAAIQNYQPDALLIFGWNYWSHLEALWTFSGEIPIFFRGDSTLLDESPGVKKWLRRAWLSWVYRHVDVALYVGSNNRAYFKAHGLSDEQLRWVPHAVDNSRFSEPPSDAEAKATAWREELGIPPDAPTIVFAGKLSRKKAPGLLLEAFSTIDQGDAHLVYAGSGPLKEPLQKRAAGSNRVHFVGFQNQSRMPTVYRLGDAFVLPSRGPGETWGLAINEAMACSRAVIASTRVGCAPDLIEPGENGFVFEAGNAEDLARCLQQVIENQDRARAMGRASRQRIRDWSIDAAAQRLEEAVVEHVTPSGSGA